MLLFIALHPGQTVPNSGGTGPLGNADWNLVSGQQILSIGLYVTRITDLMQVNSGQHSADQILTTETSFRCLLFIPDPLPPLLLS